MQDKFSILIPHNFKSIFWGRFDSADEAYQFLESAGWVPEMDNFYHHPTRKDISAACVVDYPEVYDNTKKFPKFRKRNARPGGNGHK